jgi:hypothetical protein
MHSRWQIHAFKVAVENVGFISICMSIVFAILFSLLRFPHAPLEIFACSTQALHQSMQRLVLVDQNACVLLQPISEPRGA